MKNLSNSQTFDDDDDDDSSVDPAFICPLTLEVMRHPLMTRDGLCFERSAIVEWLSGDNNNLCPLTRRPMKFSDLVPHRALEARIEAWRRMKASVAQEADQDLTASETEADYDDFDDDDDAVPLIVPFYVEDSLQVHLLTEHARASSRSSASNNSSTPSSNSRSSSNPHRGILSRRKYWAKRMRRALRPSTQSAA